MMRTNIAAFNVKPGVLDSLRGLSSPPILIPSQTLDRRYLAGSARPNGIQTTTDIAVNHVTNITIMCPRCGGDATCFENIMYQDVQLSVDKVQFPGYWNINT